MNAATAITSRRIGWTLGWGLVLAAGAQLFHSLAWPRLASVQAMSWWCWLGLMTYALLLWRWRPAGGDRRLQEVVAPPILVLPAAAFAGIWGFCAMAMALAWIRSGVVFSSGGWKGLLIDAGITLGGAFGIALVGQGSPFAWELGLWCMAALQAALLHLPWVQWALPQRIDAANAPRREHIACNLERYELLRRRVEQLLAKEV